MSPRWEGINHYDAVAGGLDELLGAAADLSACGWESLASRRSDPCLERAGTVGVALSRVCGGVISFGCPVECLTPGSEPACRGVRLVLLAARGSWLG